MAGEQSKQTGLVSFIDDSRIFLTVWGGQLVSLIGSALTAFALNVWLYEETGRASLVSFNYVAFILPQIALAPLAGVIADQNNRRRVMILADAGAALSTFALVLLVLTGSLQIWHVLTLTAINATFNTFQQPAYNAAISLLVERSQLGRAVGFQWGATAVRRVISPALAAYLLARIGLGGVAMIDIATFFFAVLMLLLVKFPAIPQTTTEPERFTSKLTFGWRWLRDKRGFLGLLGLSFLDGYAVSMAALIRVPMVLAIATVEQFGLVVAAGGLGMLLGSMAISVWGGPDPANQVKGYAFFQLIAGIGTVVAGLRPDPILISVAIFIALGAEPLKYGSARPIWLRKIPPQVQGRVLATSAMVVNIGLLIAFASGGPLVDAWLDPLLAPGGTLADSVGQVIGTGEGRGAALLHIVMGVLLIGGAAYALLDPHVREIDARLEDRV